MSGTFYMEYYGGIMGMGERNYLGECVELGGKQESLDGRGGESECGDGIPELIQIAANPSFEENKKERHAKKCTEWMVYENETLVRHNSFSARLLVNHAENGKKYLYDILAIKKEVSRPQQ